VFAALRLLSAAVWSDSQVGHPASAPSACTGCVTGCMCSLGLYAAVQTGRQLEVAGRALGTDAISLIWLNVPGWTCLANSSRQAMVRRALRLAPPNADAIDLHGRVWLPSWASGPLDSLWASICCLQVAVYKCALKAGRHCTLAPSVHRAGCGMCAPGTRSVLMPYGWMLLCHQSVWLDVAG
jgi:hypothetical protein